MATPSVPNVVPTSEDIPGNNEKQPVLWVPIKIVYFIMFEGTLFPIWLLAHPDPAKRTIDLAVVWLLAMVTAAAAALSRFLKKCSGSYNLGGCDLTAYNILSTLSIISLGYASLIIMGVVYHVKNWTYFYLCSFALLFGILIAICCRVAISRRRHRIKEEEILRQRMRVEEILRRCRSEYEDSYAPAVPAQTAQEFFSHV